VQAFVHVTHQMFSQLSPHCSPNLAAYNLGIWMWTFTLTLL